MGTEREKSPFEALTFREQQDQWLAWRSIRMTIVPLHGSANEEKAPPLAIPGLREERPVAPSPAGRRQTEASDAPFRHRELDRVYARHLSALRKTGTWQTTTSPTPDG